MQGSDLYGDIGVFNIHVICKDMKCRFLSPNVNVIRCCWACSDDAGICSIQLVAIMQISFKRKFAIPNNSQK